jgi:membrane associated rhomboid family serine protease
MRNFLRELDLWVRQWATPVVRLLVYACVVGFLLFAIAPLPVLRLFGASFDSTIFRGMIWQLLTYSWIHGSFGHLLFNLLALWMFGCRLEMRWGSRTFLRFSLVVTIGAVLTHLVITPFVGQSNVPIIGISGLVYGILFAYAYYYPDDIVYVQFLIPIKTKYFVAILGLLAFLASVSPMQTGIAHLTHLGGLLFGYLFVRDPRWFQWIPVPDLERRHW